MQRVILAILLAGVVATSAAQAPRPRAASGTGARPVLEPPPNLVRFDDGLRQASRPEAGEPRDLVGARRELLARAGQENLRYLSDVARRRPMPGEFQRSLGDLEALTARANDTSRPEADRLKSLEEVNADLVTKRVCAEKRLSRMGFGADMGDTDGADTDSIPPGAGPYDPVTVTVVTAPDSGCAVRYVLCGWFDTESRFARFDRLSTPTEHRIVPGNYYLWVEKEGRASEKLRVSLGETGEYFRTIDLRLR